MKRFPVYAQIGVVSAACLLALTACSGGADAANKGGDSTGGAAAGNEYGLPQSIKDAGEIRIGTSPDFPPMEYLDENGKLAGADVDLQKMLGKTLGVKVTVVQSPFDQLINSVETGRVDIVMSGISDTLERQKTLDFVDYFNSQGRLYTSGKRASEFTKESDICGKKLAVSGKTDYYEQAKTLSKTVCVDKGLPALQLLPTDSGSAARLQIDQGRVDLAVQGAENLAYFGKTSPGKYAAVLDALPAKPFAVLIKKGDTELANAVLKAFNKMVDDGDYKKALDAWDLGYGAMTPVINGVK